MMKRRSTILPAALLVAMFVLVVGCSQEPESIDESDGGPFAGTDPWEEFPDLVHWRTSDSLMKEQPTSEIPTLLYFTKENCGSCLSLQIAILSVEEHAKFINEHFAPVRVVGSSALRSRFGIRGVPVLIVLNPASEEVGRLTGWSGIEDTITFLEEHANITKVQV